MFYLPYYLLTLFYERYNAKIIMKIIENNTVLKGYYFSSTLIKCKFIIRFGLLIF